MCDLASCGAEDLLDVSSRRRRIDISKPRCTVHIGGTHFDCCRGEAATAAWMQSPTQDPQIRRKL